ncbi:MAG: hypothetical protein K2Y25_02815 [Pseudomonadaceae bacterium]|jgi:hypothetical protein|nr:hypothetical protein [Pseudomonadaceae bacterium]
MKALSVLLLACACLLLSGCLVLFKAPITTPVAAPTQLLGSWQRDNEWGEQLRLDISVTADNRYTAKIRVLGQDAKPEVYPFVVTRGGERWYASLSLPKRFGDNYAIAGFELTKRNELVLYSLDPERFIQELKAGTLQGQLVQTQGSDSALISSPLAQVLAYLNEPANADVFVEMARYQRIEQ